MFQGSLSHGVIQPPSPLIRLWMLRMLMIGGGHRQFVLKHSLGNDEVALALGISDSDFEDEEGSYDPRLAMRALREMHARAERQAARARLPRVLTGNLQRLGDMIGLSEIDRKLLAFTCLVHVDSTLEVTGDLMGMLSTSRVVRSISHILDLPADAVARSLAPNGLLSRSGLIQMCRSGTSFLRMKMDLLSGSFADLITSVRLEPEDLLRGTVNPAPAAELALPDYAHLGDSLDILRPYLKHALAKRRRGVNILFHGPPGTGKTQLARLLAGDAGCALFEIAGESTQGNPIEGDRRLRSFRVAQALLSRKRAMILFDDVDDVFDDGADLIGPKGTAQTHKSWMNRMLEDGQVPAFWVANSVRAIDPAFLRRFDVIIEVPVPPRSQRRRILQGACKDLVGESFVARLAESEALAPTVITRASSVVRSLGRKLDSPRAEQAIEHLVTSTLKTQGYPRPLRQGASLLPDNYNLSFLNPDVDVSAIGEGLAESGEGRICLDGPSGTGKTAFGHWLAHRLDLPLHVRRTSDLVSPLVGMTEKNLATAFQEAERDRAMLMIDEVDGFLRNRTTARHSWEVTQVNEMLTGMENFNGIFIASTNLVDGLDPAAMRRFDAKIHFGYLTADQAQEVLHAQCAAMGLAPPEAADAQALARLSNLALGDFAALARQHRFRPIASVRELVELLQAECALKGGVRRPVGFV